MSVRVMIPLDGSKLSERALPLGAAIAASDPDGVEVVHVHVPHPPIDLLGGTQYQFQGIDLDEYDRHDRAKEADYLGNVARHVRSDLMAPARWTLLEGDVPNAIDAHAEEEHTDLIVLTTHGRTGLSRLWLGSRAEALLRHTYHPMLLVPGKEGETRPEPTRLQHILVALDRGDVGEHALLPVTKLARTMGARITLLHVLASEVTFGPWTTLIPKENGVDAVEDAKEYLEGVADELRRAGYEVGTRVEIGHPVAATILAAAEKLDADLIALGTHGYGAVNRFILGSVADKVIRGSARPVLVQPPPNRA
ncbi:MAG: universal stress protein [Gemmatimonadota bacterium]